jgi:PhoPQ-activated pathogenicity-related protein
LLFRPVTAILTSFVIAVVSMRDWQALLTLSCENKPEAATPLVALLLDMSDDLG